MAGQWQGVLGELVTHEPFSKDASRLPKPVSIKKAGPALPAAYMEELSAEDKVLSRAVGVLPGEAKGGRLLIAKTEDYVRYVNSLHEATPLEWRTIKPYIFP